MTDIADKGDNLFESFSVWSILLTHQQTTEVTMSTTMFPTLHMAKALGVVVTRKMEPDGGDTMTIKVGGKKIGSVYHLPYGAGEDFHIGSDAIAELVKGFLAHGYQNTHPELFPNPTNELWLLSICAAVINEGIDLKSIKRKAKKNIMFVMEGAEDGHYIEVTAPFTPEMKARVIKQNPPDTRIAYFINDDIADL